jgi:hypothetical protein
MMRAILDTPAQLDRGVRWARWIDRSGPSRADGLGFLGIELDGQRNSGNASLLSVHGGRVKVRVIHTDEEIMIAKSVICALARGSNREA